MFLCFTLSVYINEKKIKENNNILRNLLYNNESLYIRGVTVTYYCYNSINKKNRLLSSRY